MKCTKMPTSNQWIILVVIFLFGIVSICFPTSAVELYSSQAKEKHSISLNQPGVASAFRRFEENAPTLLKLLQAGCEVGLTCVWILDSCLNAFLWLLNETVTSCADFCSCIFGVLFNIVKLLEAFGFGLKFLLELNYAALSYIFDTLGGIKDSFNHVVTLVKITIANETEHVYESSSMVFEGMQNLFLTACSQTWVNVQYISSVVTSNFSAPFGLSNLDTSLVASMIMSGCEFFVESIKLAARMFKDGNLFLFNYTCDTLYTIGKVILDNGIAFLCCIKDVALIISRRTAFLVTWPFYCLASIVSNISHMLHYSWDAFVNLVGCLDTSIREIVYVILRTTVSGTSDLAYNITEFIYKFFPGGIVGFTVFASVVITLILWHEEITALLRSSWISLRRMNDIARPLINIPEDQQHFEVQEPPDIADSSTSQPPLHRKMPRNQNELKYELELEKDKRLCVICQDNVKNILLLPCRHVCMCRQCLHELTRHLGQCPLCRQHIQSSLEVFV